jgi:hypothetical protein
MSRQIRYDGETYSSTGGGDHEKLGNRRGAGIDGEAFHLDRDMYGFVQANYSGSPATPVNLSPAEGETDVYQFPEFMGSAYSSPREVPMLGIEIRIGLDPEILEPVYEGYVETSQTSARFSEFEAIIQTDTMYFWSLRYVDADGRKSNSSVPTGFVTAAEFQPSVVLRPNIIYPAEGARTSPLDPMLLSSPFRIIGATDTHEASDWQAASRADFDPAYILAESLDDGTNLESVIFSGTDLTGDLGFYARTRQKGALAGWSGWSPICHALLKEFHNDFLIGIGITEGGAVYHIDGEGNLANVRNDYFEKNPLYAFPRAIVAGQYMRALLETHVRCDHDAGGFKYRYWISPYAFRDSIVHPAFALSGAGPLLFGEYLSGNDEDSGSVASLNSSPDKYLRPSSAASKNAAWLNTGEDNSHRGWGLLSVYERQLLNLLMLVEARSFSLNKAISSKQIFSGINGADRPNFHGITHPVFNSSSGWGTLVSLGEGIDGVFLGTYYARGWRLGLPSTLDDRYALSVPGGSVTSAAVFVDQLKTDADPNFGPLQLLFIPGTVTTGSNSGINMSLGTRTLTMPAVDSSTMSYSYDNDGIQFPFLYSGILGGTPGVFMRLVKRSA